MMEILIFFSGLAIGVAAVSFYFFTKKGNAPIDLKKMETDLGKIADNINQKDFSFQNMMEDQKEEMRKFTETAKEFQNTLISGGAGKQGKLGEGVLIRLLEKMGFTEGREYRVHNKEGDKVPDIIVTLPNKKSIVIDSKISLNAWEEYLQASNEQIKNISKKKHIEAVRAHIKGLSEKNYQKFYNIKTLDTTVMFMVNEQSVHSLGEESVRMWEYAWDKNITLVGPSQLFFILKIAHHHWSVDRQSKNIAEVSKQGVAIYDKVIGIYESISKALSNFKSTVKYLQEAKNKLQDGKDSLLGKIEKMKKIGGLNPTKSIPDNIKNDIIEEEDKAVNE